MGLNNADPLIGGLVFSIENTTILHDGRLAEYVGMELQINRAKYKLLSEF